MSLLIGCDMVFEQVLSILGEMPSTSVAFLGAVPVDLRPKFRIAHTKHDVISILMNEYTYINMYIIKKIISCITDFFKA